MNTTKTNEQPTSAEGVIRDDPPFNAKLMDLLWSPIGSGSAHIITGPNGKCMCGVTENGESVGCRDIIYNAVLRQFRDFLRQPAA